MERRPTTKRLATAERADLLDLVTHLGAEQWDAATLCEGWSVREVVAHILSYEDQSIAQTVAAFVRDRFDTDRINEVALRPFRALTPEQLVTRVRDHQVPKGLTGAFGGAIALADGMIHQQDIRRALGRHRVIPADRVIAAMTIALQAPTLPSRRRVRGLRLVATDADWSRGQGPELRGPIESLLMLVAGRDQAAADCEGPGLERLLDRG